jgi:hypothetical protein
MLMMNGESTAATSTPSRAYPQSVLPLAGALLAIAGSILLLAGMMPSPTAPIAVKAAPAPVRGAAHADHVPAVSPRREYALAQHTLRQILETPRRQPALYSGEGRTLDILADSRRPSLDMMLAERAATHSAFRRRWETDHLSSSLAADPRTALMAMAEGDRSRSRIDLRVLPTPLDAAGY